MNTRKTEKRVLGEMKQRGFFDFIYCNQCGKRVAKHHRYEYLYGSPVRECPFCKDIYIDEHYREIAMEGIDPSSKKKIMPLLIIGIIIGIILLISGVSSTSDEVYGLIIPGGFLFMVCSFVQIYNIVNYKKTQEDIAHETAASKKRLTDPKYVQLLEECGYDNVTHKYLTTPGWDEIARRLEKYNAAHDNLK